jgi:predicted dehydrogenase
MSEQRIGIGFLGVDHLLHAGSYAAALGRTGGVDLVGIYDEDPGLGRAFAQAHGIPDCYTSPAELLARGDLHAVVVCSPTDTHASLVTAAARYGKHVLCEKPISTALADGQAMVDACAAAGIQFHVAYTSRFYPVLQEAKRLIAARRLGEVVGIRGGNRGCPPLPSYGEHPGWLLEPGRAGGGALIDHSVHVTDAVRYLLEDEIESVFAETGTLLHPALPVEDCALLLLKLRGGAVVSVDPSWSIPANNPYHYDLYLHILGTLGTLSVDDTRQALRVVRDGAAGRGVVREPFGVDIDASLVRKFVQSVRQGQLLEPCASGLDGLRSLEIALAAYQSSQTGQPVMLNHPA